MTPIRRILAAAALMLSLSACQATVTYTTELAEDGSGTFAVGLTLDAEAREQLAATGSPAIFDRLTAQGWAASEIEDADGGVHYEIGRTFEDPSELDEIFDELRGAGTGREIGDFGGIDLQIELEAVPGRVSSSYRLDGSIDFGGLNDLPAEALAELNRAAAFQIVADLPGDARVSDGDAILDEQGRVVWQPQLGEPMTFAASSTVRDPALFIGILLGGAALGLAALAGMVRHRRRGRRHEQPTGGLRIEHSNVEAFDVEAAAARIHRQQQPSPASLDEFEFPRAQPSIEQIDALLDGPGATSAEPPGSAS